MSIRRTAVFLVAATSAAALVTSCSSGSSSHTGGKDSGTRPVANTKSNVNKSLWPKATPDSGLAKGLALPLQAYMQTYQDTVVIDNARRHLMTSCMADYGLDVTFPPAGQTPPPSADDSNLPRRYGITDRAMAAEYGFGLPDGIQHQQAPQMPELTQDQIEVLTGHTSIRRAPTDPKPKKGRSTYKGKKVHKDGCAGWADDKLETRNMDFSLVSRLDGESLTQSQKSPVVQKAIKAWSTCMSGQGYTAETPYDADEIVPHTDGKPSQEEIKVALADIDCKKSTHLVKIWFKEDARIQRQQIKDHKAQLEALRKRKTHATAAAKRVLNG